MLASCWLLAVARSALKAAVGGAWKALIVKSDVRSFRLFDFEPSLAKSVPLRVLRRTFADVLEASDLLCLSPVDLLHRLVISLHQHRSQASCADADSTCQLEWDAESAPHEPT